jgi:AraC-like DNA-binding protein
MGPLRSAGRSRAIRKARPRILLADADIGVQATLSVMLESHFLMADACSHEEALVLSIRSAPDLLIVSASQPGLDAGALVQALRARVSGCPVLVLADAQHVTAARDLMGLGINGYFIKPLRFERLLNQIATLLARGRRPPVVGRLSAHVSDAIQYLSYRHHRFPSVTDLAARAGVSVSHLSHAFSLSTQMPPKEYLTRVRIEVAKRLLFRTSDKLEVIAAGLGFADTSHLSRVFRARTGQTPGRFRRAGEAQAS